MKKLLLLSSALVVSATAANAEESIKHKGTAEGGITIANGNTESENYRGSLSFTSTYDIYTNIFKADALNVKETGNRTGERYDISNQTKAKFSETSYGFLQVDFTEDRYQGFNYRVSELVGIGNYFTKSDDLTILGEIAAGARQTDFTLSTDDEETAIVRLSADIDWKINEHVTFDHRTDYSIGEDNNLTHMTTGVKAFIDQNLYIRFAHELIHNSETPLAVKNTDTRTFVTVGYEF